MEHKHFGYILIAGGAVLQVAESMAAASASLNNTTFPETPVGKLVTPIEAYLPVQLGWALIIAGVTICFVLPFIKDKL